MKGRTTFTADEFRRIRELVRELENAGGTAAKKGLRQKIRNIGLYWSEVAQGTDYSVANLDALASRGVLKVTGQKPGAVTSLSPATIAVPEKWTFSIGSISGRGRSRSASDEHYVIDLCDEVLKQTAFRQHRFPFLLGDSGTMLPVDAYYEKLNLVIEYYERQHSEAVAFFDRRQTVSGVSRGEQRRIYDDRRRTELPKHGIRLLVISWSDFGTSKKLLRDHGRDINIVRDILHRNDLI